ncbi:ATP synthase subunit c [Oxobacter pfennigii]|uniref:ATP synthase subunit c n=1 Tax=Oxobacter pfennigii TaxID=36849 RepID=A0A0N8NU00_9CLOT|nr:ATP synthase subunit C [Oxobacter pfennigii]KPU46248.1 ATP synthase subunit c [Oxobacter pfennigii]
MYIILLLMIFIVLATISTGIVIRFKEERPIKAKGKTLIKANLSLFIPILAAAVIFLIPEAAHAAEGEAASPSGLGFIAAALSTGLATIGTGYAVGSVGSSALGAVSEDPKILGKTLIFVGLAEGIAIYGLIVSIMILGRL